MCYASQQKATAKADERKEKKMETKKMIVKVYQDRETGKKELTNTWEEQTNILLQLTAFLYRKTIQKSSNLKITYKYNYTDYQTIIIKESYQNYDNTTTNTWFEFENIPTNMGYLDIYKIEKNLKENEGENNE